MMKKRWCWLNLLLVGILATALVAPFAFSQPAYASVTLTLRPNAAGDYTNIPKQTPDSGAHWDKMDDVTPDGVETRVMTDLGDTTQVKDAYNLENSPGIANITSVKVYFRFRGNAYGQPFLRLGSSETAGTVQTLAIGQGWVTFSEVLARPGGGDWTEDDINNLQVCIGIRVMPGFPLSAADATQVYVEVVCTLTTPVVTTNAATSSEDTATLNGNVTAINDSSITSRGFVWDTSSHGVPGNVAPASSGYANPWKEDWVEGDPWLTGSFTHDIPVVAGTVYYIRACAMNSNDNWGYGGEITFGVPLIIANAASDIASTTARLNSTVSYDGAGTCQVRWGYSIDSVAPEDFEDLEVGYGVNGVITEWAGNYTTGHHPYYDALGLLTNPPKKYYYRVQIKNSISTVTSADEIDFTTLSGVGNPSNLRAIPSSTSVSLAWTKGSGSTESVVKCRVDKYPESYTDGQPVYQGPSPSYNYTGLTPGRTYYIAVWGKSGTYYSSGSATAIVTTSAGLIEEGATLETPTEPSRWMAEPNYVNLKGLGPIYDVVNMTADAMKMPRETAWMFAAISAAVAFAFMVLFLSRGSVLGSLIALTIGLAFWWRAEIISMWFPVFTLAITISFFLVRRREA